MKVTYFRKKLVLKKITIADLNPATMRHILGGTAPKMPAFNEFLNNEPDEYTDTCCTRKTEKTCPPEIPQISDSPQTG